MGRWGVIVLVVFLEIVCQFFVDWVDSVDKYGRHGLITDYWILIKKDAG
jgi:hypothetical protein